MYRIRRATTNVYVPREIGIGVPQGKEIRDIVTTLIGGRGPIWRPVLFRAVVDGDISPGERSDEVFL